VQEYAGTNATLYHVDLYRLEAAEVDDLGLEDLVSGDGVVAIEWAERWRGRPDDVTEVWIEVMPEDRRSIKVRTPR
jgi:tRNA threonylcarbamoyladenosine biosynthesis protein TsaE